MRRTAAARWICHGGEKRTSDISCLFLGYLTEISGRFSAKLGPKTPLERHGSSCSAVCTKIQPGRQIRRPFRGTKKLPPDCLQLPSFKKTVDENGVCIVGLPLSPGDAPEPKIVSNRRVPRRQHTFGRSRRKAGPYVDPEQPSLAVHWREKSEFRIDPFHLGTRRVAEVAPHLGLPVRGPSRRHALETSKLLPVLGGKIPAIPDLI